MWRLASHYAQAARLCLQSHGRRHCRPTWRKLTRRRKGLAGPLPFGFLRPPPKVCVCSNVLPTMSRITSLNSAECALCSHLARDLKRIYPNKAESGRLRFREREGAQFTQCPSICFVWRAEPGALAAAGTLLTDVPVFPTTLRRPERVCRLILHLARR